MRPGNTKNMTPKQLAANRRNAMKSTGPRTARGRDRSRMNALQHGLLAQAVVVQGVGLRESASQLQALRRQFFEHCAPVGPLEAMLVEQIVTCYWRKRRVLKAESGEIAVSVGEGARERERARAGQRERWKLAGVIQGESKLKTSTAGLDYLTETLETALSHLVVSGELNREAMGEVIGVFGAEANGVTHELAVLNDWRKRNPDGLKAGALGARYRQEVLAFIGERLKEYRMRREVLAERERKEEEARRTASVLPEAEVVNRIVRYETALDRQLFRLLRQLERWQRLRLGEKLPLPMATTASEEGMDGAVSDRRKAGPGHVRRGKPRRAGRNRDAARPAVAPYHNRRRSAPKAKPGRAGASRRDAESVSMIASRSDAAPISASSRRRLRGGGVASHASRCDAAAFKTNPNDERGENRETPFSNEKLNISNLSGPRDETCFCETKPNERMP